MKRFFAFAAGLVLLTSPALALAGSWQSVAQLLAVAAALQAQQNSLSSGDPLACAALFSTSSVRVGQNVALAWGSVGALDPSTSSSSVSLWTQNGASTLTFAKPGTWTYQFTFYSADNASTTCAAKVVVTK